MRFISASRLARRTALAAVGLATFAGAALALEEPKDEKDKLKACEKNLCSIVSKKGSGSDLACVLGKTWHRDKLKEGSAAGKISWGFGDARCSVDLKVSRQAIVDALSQPEATLQFDEHTVTCDIEREKEVSHVTAKLTPKVMFKDGQAKKIWVNLKHVEGPSVIKGLAVTAAKLEDSVGIFHKPLVKALNHMLHEKCPKVASGG